MKTVLKNIHGTVSGKTITAVALLGIFAIFIVQNTKVVEIRLLFWEISLSRVVLLLGSLIIGILVGLFIGWETSSTGKKSGRTDKL